MSPRAHIFVLTVGLLLAAGPTLAQERSPAHRQSLIDLAYALGESHALRQACNGAYDQFWRDRMLGMTDAEAPDATLDRRLKEAFNSGFAARRAEFPACSRDSRLAEVAAARRGEALARRMGSVAYRLDPREAEARRAAELGLEPALSPEPPSAPALKRP
ncbi:TIGR02301 family protein [Phenylobacterium sp.]|uniref:TIGR02301 family protein n=1 Tax=Phenylobacterium sp. TaxID=1871053 RepID=UPI002FD9CF8E